MIILFDSISLLSLFLKGLLELDIHRRRNINICQLVSAHGILHKLNTFRHLSLDYGYTEDLVTDELVVARYGLCAEFIFATSF
mgnify:CR=1 FL=1